MDAFKHWSQVIDDDGLFWLTLDRNAESINTLNQEVLLELECLLSSPELLAANGLIIKSGKKNGFIAGADITQFELCKNKDELFNLIRHGQLVFDKLASLKIPTVAMIHGFCLGGGYELALACKYRVASDAVTTKIGLPEIKLGIHPGWGGCIRLPALVGAVSAMSIILPGSAVSARAACKIGMIDKSVPLRQLENAARFYALQQPALHKPSFIHGLTNKRWVRGIVAKFLHKQLRKKHVNQAHYPAPFAVIDNWLRDGIKGDAMINEAHSITDMIQTGTAASLARVFFLQGKMKESAKGIKYSPTHVHVIGAGTMGGDIASWCALQGMRVTLQDQNAKSIAPAIARAHKMFKRKLKKPYLIDAAMDRLQVDISGYGVKNADIIIEAVFENLKVKQEIFKNLEQQAKPDALLATNTSSIPLEDISSCLSQPSRLIGIHFFNPVSKMPLVEIVKSDVTLLSLIRKASAFVVKIKRSPVVVASQPGFLVNRVLMPYLMEAMYLLQEGVSAQRIDKAAMDFGMPMGPITLADTIGLDVALSVAENLAECLGGTVPDKLKEMVKNGDLGVKSGNGFYSYKKGRKINVSDTSDPSIEKTSDITDRMILSMLNEAVSCLASNVVSDDDLLDAGMIFGTGFAPFRGGPIHYAKQRGILNVVAKL
jgi:3-hydroxyacyl-CoA dehydrogenase / enoyl-CoA hydratase / 3-hydroxybutyryl-CoA epimerase